MHEMGWGARGEWTIHCLFISFSPRKLTVGVGGALLTCILDSSPSVTCSGTLKQSMKLTQVFSFPHKEFVFFSLQPFDFALSLQWLSPWCQSLMSYSSSSVPNPDYVSTWGNWGFVFFQHFTLSYTAHTERIFTSSLPFTVSALRKVNM